MICKGKAEPYVQSTRSISTKLPPWMRCKFVAGLTLALNLKFETTQNIMIKLSARRPERTERTPRPFQRLRTPAILKT